MMVLLARKVRKSGMVIICPGWSRLASRRSLCGRQRLARRNAVHCAAKKGPLDEEGPKNRTRVIGQVWLTARC
jgi:hypothetical protein